MRRGRGIIYLDIYLSVVLLVFSDVCSVVYAFRDLFCFLLSLFSYAYVVGILII